MALKYYLEYTTRSIKPDNTEDVVINKCEIYNDDFTGEATEITGYCILTKASTKDVLQAIRGGGLKIILDASVDLDFTDLYSEEERTFNVKYFINNINRFDGWIEPEGLFQDFVYDKWQITINCFGSLSYLKNLSYLDEVTKNTFSGKQNGIEIISNCLKRTKINKDILVKVDFYYEPLNPSINSTLRNTFFNVDRFIKEDNLTIMSCEEVLISILELFGAVITYHNNYWVIYKPNLLSDTDSFNFWNYDYNGNIVPPTGRIELNLYNDLGSQINGFYPHHANANQTLEIQGSIGATSVLYTYGLVKSLFSNINLVNVNGVVDEWTVNDNTNLTFPANNEGLIITTEGIASSSVVMTSNSFSFEEGNRIKFKTVFKKNDVNELLNGLFQVVLTDNTNNYYLSIDGRWKTELSTRIDIEAIEGGFTGTFFVDSDTMPIDGEVYIKIFEPYNNFDTNSILITECNYTPINTQDKKGEKITLQRKTNPSNNVFETKEVFNNSDLNQIDSYYGTMYKSDEITPIEIFIREEPFRALPLIYLMAEERMKMYNKPRKIFKGDFLGYFNYLSVIVINNINGRFMPISYEYNSKTNVTKANLVEVLNDNIISDLSYNFDYDYGNTQEPTIKS